MPSGTADLDCATLGGSASDSTDHSANNAAAAEAAKLVEQFAN